MPNKANKTEGFTVKNGFSNYWFDIWLHFGYGDWIWLRNVVYVDDKRCEAPGAPEIHDLDTPNFLLDLLPLVRLDVRADLLLHS